MNHSHLRRAIRRLKERTQDQTKQQVLQVLDEVVQKAAQIEQADIATDEKRKQRALRDAMKIPYGGNTK